MQASNLIEPAGLVERLFDLDSGKVKFRPDGTIVIRIEGPIDKTVLAVFQRPHFNESDEDNITGTWLVFEAISHMFWER